MSAERQRLRVLEGRFVLEQAPAAAASELLAHVSAPDGHTAMRRDDAADRVRGPAGGLDAAGGGLRRAGHDVTGA